MEGQEKTIHPDFLQDIFLEETWKNIDRTDEFIARKTTEEEIHFTTEEVDELFRTMHSIKGSSAMMGYPAIPLKDFMRQVSYLQKLSKK